MKLGRRILTLVLFFDLVLLANAFTVHFELQLVTVSALRTYQGG